MYIVSTNHFNNDLPILLWKHHVVVLRDLVVKPSLLITIGEMFGDVWRNVNDSSFAVDPGAKLLRITGIKKDNKPTGLFGNNDLEWHCDFAHSIGEYHGTLLYNNLNGELSKTIFADTRKAWLDLSEDLQTMSSNVIGYHKVTSKAYRRPLTPAEERLLRVKKFKPDNVEFSTACVHDDSTPRPLAPIHPVTGDRSLYLAPATWERSSPELTHEQYRLLLDHCTNDRYLYTHDWKPGDIVLFDNLTTMHRRGPFTGDRILWRMQFNYDKHMA